MLAACGCYAPLHSPGIPANQLSEEFRIPFKRQNFDINFAMLRRSTPPQYLISVDDIVRVEVSDLQPFKDLDLGTTNNRSPRADIGPETRDIQISSSGTMLLPLIGEVYVENLTLDQAQKKVVAAYSDGFIDSPQVSVSLVQKKVVPVLVLGGVAQPGRYELPNFENDIAHAIAAAGGVIEEQDEIQVHRRTAAFAHPEELPPLVSQNRNGVQQASFTSSTTPTEESGNGYHLHYLRIPLRGTQQNMITAQQAELHEGDVVIVRKMPDEVFFVVGDLSENNQVRFTLGNQNRDLGNGFVLPKDRDVDVVTAVAMAGYIDPIESPTTVTVHRTQSDGGPLLIKVDLIAARFDRRENIMVLAGDIIYLNPDPAWWMRRTFDRIVPTLLTNPFTEGVQRLINPRQFN